MKIKNFIRSGILSAALALSMLGAAVPAVEAEAAAKGPDKSSDSYAYLCISDETADSEGKTDTKYLYMSETISEMQKEYGGSTSLSKVKGATYNEKSNTLTLNNFKQPAKRITANMMGDDFKIVLKGTNSLQVLAVYGDNYGGSVTIKGSGSLTCNKTKKASSASFGSGIFLGAEHTASVLTIEKTATVTSFGNKYNGFAADENGEFVEQELVGHPIYVYAHTSNKASKIIKAQGKVTGGKYKVEKNTEDTYNLYCTASKFVNKKK